MLRRLMFRVKRARQKRWEKLEPSDGFSSKSSIRLWRSAGRRSLRTEGRHARRTTASALFDLSTNPDNETYDFYDLMNSELTAGWEIVR